MTAPVAADGFTSVTLQNCLSLGVHLTPGVESAKSLFFGVEGDGVLHRNAGQMDENRQAEKDDSI